MKRHANSPDQSTTQFFYEAIAAIKNPLEAQQFLEDLCTPAELEAMIDRWQVIPLLVAEKSYQKIHDETGVSVTTVGRVARCLTLGKGGYKLIYERLIGMKLGKKK